MKINKTLIISMLLIAVFAIGAVSASEDISDDTAIGDVETIDEDIQTIENDDVLSENNHEDTHNVLTDDEGAGDEKVTKNITIYAGDELVNSFNFTTDAGNNFSFADVLQILGQSGEMDMSNFGAFGEMFSNYNFTDETNKNVDFTISGDVNQVQYSLRMVSNENTFIFDYKIASPKTTNATEVSTETLSIYADDEFLSNISFSSDGFDFSQLMNQFANTDFDMSSMGSFAENFKTMTATESTEGKEDNRSYYFKIDGLVGDIKYDMLVTSNTTDFVFDYGIKYPKVETTLTAKDLTVTTVNTAVDGKIGKYLSFTLKDSYGEALAGKQVIIVLNNVEYKVKTNSNGVAKVQVNIAKAGTYTATAYFMGEEGFGPAYKKVKVTVKKQTAKLTTTKKTYKANAKTKTLTATFKSAKGKAIKGKKISFKVNGKTYTATTNAKGVATVKVKLTKKGSYTFTASFAGDSTYNKISKKAKLVIK